MPAEGGGRLHQEQDHASAVRVRQRGRRGSSEDEQLLAEDEKFEIAIGRGAAAKDEEIDQQAEEGIEEGQA